VEAVVRPEHRGPSDGLTRALREWPGIHYWASGADAGRLVLVRSLAPLPRERWWLHVALFLGTFLTVQLGGFVLLGGAQHPSLAGDWSARAASILQWLRSSVAGMPFAMALLSILLAHEMGHYLTARRYGINASPPYFLPAPVEINFIGTFGAFIRLRSPVVDRRQLMDVGAAGPWVGFIVALLLLIVGMQYSYLVPPGEYDFPMVIELGRGSVYLGDSLITWGARELFMGEGTAVLHPLAVAGCFGVLVTALNLLPLGQLDGGHIVYALLRDRQRYVGMLTWFGLIVLGQVYWGWWVWAGLILLLSGGRLAHPRVLEPLRPLPASRVPIGWASIGLFALTFAPVPLAFQ
jgi:membrane-associated protease RseP (regulator of RpoE activity)